MMQGADIQIDDKVGPKVLWNAPDEFTKSIHMAFPPPTTRAEGLAELPEADTVVFQRPARRWWADLIPHWQAAGIKVVVDIDDRFDRIRLDDIAYRYFNDQGRQDFGWEHIDRACRLADLVTTSTPALAKRFGYGHAQVLPNLVPAAYLKVNTPKEAHSVGWSGTLETHFGDLQVTEGAIGTVLRDHAPWCLVVIGPPDGVGKALKLPPKTYIGSTGWVGFHNYAHYVCQLVVGIVPLALNVFNESKSALKLAEFSSLGIAAIASPTPDDIRLNKLGAGVLAASPSQWARKLRALVTNEGYRSDLAASSREAMRSQTYEAQCGRWLDAWTR